MKEIIRDAFSYWLKANVEDANMRQILARSMGWEYTEVNGLPETELVDIYLITNKKMISPAIDYIPVHRSSHLVHTFDFDDIKDRFIRKGRLTIGGNPGTGKTALAYLLIRSLPRPFWFIKLKGNVHIEAEDIEKLALATDTPVLLFADKDMYDVHIGGIKPSDTTITLMLDRHGDINLGAHSPDAARYMVEEILKAPAEKPKGKRIWLEIALYIRNKVRNPEFAKDIWESGLDTAWQNLINSLPEPALFLLKVVATEGEVVAPKKLIKLKYPKVKKLDFIEKLVSVGILHRNKNGHFTLLHPYWKKKINGIINIG
ncbi:hypothetical protein GM182_06880 [bacterium 3DAC]|nr:hypothetical protein [Dictyoglomota bacterium]UZN23570.1 hypothetical protein GM182_06880 [bacterium 3DAC]